MKQDSFSETFEFSKILTKGTSCPRSKSWKIIA